MNRRDFLRVLGMGSAAAAAATILPSPFESAELDPERLLWKPGAKTFFLPGETPLRLATPAALQPGDTFTIEDIAGTFEVKETDSSLIWVAGRPAPGIVRVTTNRGYGVDYNHLGHPVACWTEPDKTVRELRDLPTLRWNGGQLPGQVFSPNRKRGV